MGGVGTEKNIYINNGWELPRIASRTIKSETSEAQENSRTREMKKITMGTKKLNCLELITIFFFSEKDKILNQPVEKQMIHTEGKP